MFFLQCIFFFISEAFSLMICLNCTASALLLHSVTWSLSAGTRPWWCLSCTTPPIAPGREFLWWSPSSGSWLSPFPARCSLVSTPQVRLMRFEGVERTAEISDLWNSAWKSFLCCSGGSTGSWNQLYRGSQIRGFTDFAGQMKSCSFPPAVFCPRQCT